MTVYRSLANWLNGILADPDNGFPEELKVAIDVELVPNLQSDFPELKLQESALISHPNDQHVLMTAGQYKHTEHKTWYLVRRFGDHDNRAANEDFLERIRRCIQRETLMGNMPKCGRAWRKILVNGGMFPSAKSTDNTSAVYQIPLRIEYIE